MTHINQRRDLSANWVAANPVLHQGEVGWETDTRKAKLGDGTTPWNDLEYAVASSGGDVASVNGKTGVVVLDKTDIGLGNVDNTADADKPVSAATAAAISAAISAALLASRAPSSRPQRPIPSLAGKVRSSTPVATSIR